MASWLVPISLFFLLVAWWPAQDSRPLPVKDGLVYITVGLALISIFGVPATRAWVVDTDPPFLRYTIVVLWFVPAAVVAVVLTMLIGFDRYCGTLC